MRIQPNRQTALIVGFLGLGILVLAVAFRPQTRSTKPLASADLGDGRIVEVEALTFGTNHFVGTKPLIPKYARKWLPFWIIKRDQPQKQWQSFQMESPGTVIWLNAVDKNTGAYVKCDDLSASLLTESGAQRGLGRHLLHGARFFRAGIRFPPPGGTTMQFEIAIKSTNAVRFSLEIGGR